MRNLPKTKLKEHFATLLADAIKRDWVGETSDHLSTAVTVRARRVTAACLLKGRPGSKKWPWTCAALAPTGYAGW